MSCSPVKSLNCMFKAFRWTKPRQQRSTDSVFFLQEIGKSDRNGSGNFMEQILVELFDFLVKIIGFHRTDLHVCWQSYVLTCSDYDEFCRFNNLCVYHSCPWSFHWCPCLRLQLIYTTSCGRWQPATSACNFTFKPPTVTNSSTWENCFIDFQHDNGAIDGGRRRCQRSEMRWALVIAWPIWPWPWNSPMLTLILLNLWRLMWWQQFWKLCFSGISTFYIGYLSPTASQMCLRQTS